MALFGNTSSSTVKKTTQNITTYSSSQSANAQGAQGALNLQVGAGASFSGSPSAYYAPLSIAYGDKAVKETESTKKALEGEIGLDGIKGIDFAKIIPWVAIAVVAFFLLKR